MVNSKNLIIIPTYNEIENILIVIDKVLNLPTIFDVLVVDDNSPDGTAKIVSHHIKKMNQGFISKLEKKNKVWVRHIFTGFYGLLKMNMNIFLRWMQTYHMIQKI